jgi:hypothetical protein
MPSMFTAPVLILVLQKKILTQKNNEFSFKNSYIYKYYEFSYRIFSNVANS